MADDRLPEELAKLQKKLYQRDARFADPRSELPPLKVDPQTTAWNQETKTPDIIMPVKTTKSFPFIKFILVVSVVFFVGAIGLAGFQYFRGLNVVSSTNIDLSVQGLDIVNAGDELQIAVATANRNQKDLADVRLSVVFPDGTKDPNDPTKNLRELREVIGGISSGQVVVKNFNALVYGDEQQKKTVELSLEYKIVGSNATFTKREVYEFTIGSSPVRVVAVAPEEVNSGQSVSLAIQAATNVQSTANDLAVLVSYPAGFTFESADPAPTNGTNVWSLAELRSGQTKNIVIRGKLAGQNDEVKSFQIRTGTLAMPTDLDLNIEYGSLIKTVAIRKPFVDLRILVSDRDLVDTVIDSEKVVPIKIEWKNTLPTTIIDGRIEVVVNGDAVDERSIVNRGGHYEADSRTIVWDSSYADLRSIAPGDVADAEFSIVTKSLLTGAGVNFNRPEINLRVRFTGTTVSGDNINLPVEVLAEKSLKVNTVAQFLARGLYYAGAFSQTGPMPPKVGQETLYTIEWTVLNSTNDVKEAKVQAVLPTGLRFVGSIIPTGEKVTFNPTTRVIVWEIGNLKAASLGGGGRREVSFQVGLTPSPNQVNSTPVLLRESFFAGIDTFTQKVLNIGVRDIDIRLLNDPQFTTKEAVVAP